MKKYLSIFVFIVIPFLLNAQISESMKLFIKQEEGLSTTAYMDGDEVAVGYGHHVCYTPYDYPLSILIAKGLDLSKRLTSR